MRRSKAVCGAHIRLWKLRCQTLELGRICRKGMTVHRISLNGRWSDSMATARENTLQWGECPFAVTCGRFRVPMLQAPARRPLRFSPGTPASARLERAPAPPAGVALRVSGHEAIAGACFCASAAEFALRHYVDISRSQCLLRERGFTRIDNRLHITGSFDVKSSTQSPDSRPARGRRIPATSRRYSRDEPQLLSNLARRR